MQFELCLGRKKGEADPSSDVLTERLRYYWSVAAIWVLPASELM